MAFERFLSAFKRALESFRVSRLAAKMAGGVFWLSVGSVPSRIAALAATFLVVRILGKYTNKEK